MTESEHNQIVALDNAAFEAAAAALPVPFRVMTPDLLCAFVSPALRELHPIQAGQRCCEGFGMIHRATDCITAKCLAAAAPQAAHRWLGKRYVRIEAHPVYNPAGRIIAVAEWIQDQSVVKKLEAALVEKQDILETINKAMIEANHHLEDMQRDGELKNIALEVANEKLRSLDKLKDEFVSIVSHELKVPLTSIRGSVDMVMDELPDAASPRARDLLAICKRNIIRLQKLVTDLLDLARIEAGHLSLQFEHFAVENWLSDCLDSIRAQAEAKHLRVDLHVEPGLSIDGDRERLLQVVVNLLNNAVKFTAAGAIRVAAHRDEKGLVLHIIDSGPGLPPDALNHVFDKYAQYGDAAQRAHGFGLGLTIARGIISEHGGELTATSELGNGTTFTVRVPQPLKKIHDEFRSVN